MSHTDAPKLFFHHNPKAGGTAVAHALEGLYPCAARSPRIENTQRDHERLAGDYAASRGYAYYGGHYGYDVFKAVTDGHQAITNFRNPVGRLVSLYNFYRSIPLAHRDAAQLDELYPVVFAHKVDFHTFVSTDDPRIEVHTRNHLVRQLTCSAWDTNGVADLDHAIAVVRNMPWFYVAEQRQASQDWGRAVFGERFPPIATLNVSAEGGQALSDIEPATHRIIAAKNVLDAGLYACATRLLATRG